MIPARRLVPLSIVPLLASAISSRVSRAQDNPGPNPVGNQEASAPAPAAAQAQEYSHVRIVRLSFVEGSVSVQRPEDSEWATAHVNTPLEEGFRLSTAEGGYTEAEFENASTARFGQLALVEFTQLALLPSGGKVNRLTLHQGYGTFNFLPGADDYEVKAGAATLIPRGKSRFRVDLDQGFLQVKVFKGTVEFQSPEGNGTLANNTVLLVRPEGSQRLEITQGISKDAWDGWVEQREEIAQSARNRGAPAAATAGIHDFLYGFAELMLYGDWYSHPTYGYVWRPLPVSGWNPYVSGFWGWDPRFGYVWNSFEPWGWLPYHYGGWIYLGNRGWVWSPRGFGGWSPATVNWYQGKDWVGWSPRPPRGVTGPPRCPAQGCITAVDVHVFRDGRPIGSNRYAGDPLLATSRGQPVNRPNVQPGHGAILPGTVRPQTPANPGSSPTRGTVVNSGTLSTPAGGVREPDRGRPGGIPGSQSAPAVPTDISNQRAQPVSPPVVPTAPSGMNAARPNGAVGGIVRPGPRENYPVPPALEALRSRSGPEGRSSSNRGVGNSQADGTTFDRSSGTPSSTPRGAAGRAPGVASTSSSRPAPSASGLSVERGTSSAGRGASSSGTGKRDSGGGAVRSGSAGSSNSRSGSSSSGRGRSSGGGGSSGGKSSSSSSGGHSSSGGAHSSGGSPKH